MNIELRNVKYCAFMSEETSCFDATVYVDGKRAGTAHNDGHGGMTFIEPRELELRLNAYAATLPPVASVFTEEDGTTSTIEQSGESLIDDLLHAHLISNDLKRTLKRSILFVGTDGQLRTTKPRQGVTLQQWINHCSGDKRAETLARLNASEVLNFLPFADALKIYSAHGA